MESTISTPETPAEATSEIATRRDTLPQPRSGIGQYDPFLLVMIVALVIATPIHLFLIYQAITADTHTTYVLAIMVLGGVIGMIVAASAQMGRGVVASFTVRQSEAFARDGSLHYLADCGLRVINDNLESMQFSRQHAPKRWLLGLLAFYGVLPAAIYWTVGTRQQLVDITWESGSHNKTAMRMLVTPEHPDGRKLIADLHEQLTLPALPSD